MRTIQDGLNESTFILKARELGIKIEQDLFLPVLSKYGHTNMKIALVNQFPFSIFLMSLVCGVF